MLLLLGLQPSAAAADRPVHLQATFQGLQATATVTVPDDWRTDASGDHVKLVAPSHRKGCDHELRLRLRLLYVGNAVTAPDWVGARLAGQGPILAKGGDGYSWAVAAPPGRRTSLGYGALVAGNGRFGRIMVEVRATTDLTSRCTDAQSRPAAKRLTRVLEALALRSAKGKRER